MGETPVPCVPSKPSFSSNNIEISSVIARNANQVN